MGDGVDRAERRERTGGTPRGRLRVIDPGLVLDGPTRQRLAARFGDGTGAWCDALPGLVGLLSARWGFTVEAALPGGNSSRTLRCRTADGRSAVLKLVPEPELAAAEIAVLRIWSSAPGVVKLLDADLEHGALLLEGLSPGTPLMDSRRQITLPELATLMPQLHLRLARNDFPSLAERMDFLFQLAEKRRTGSRAARFVTAEHVRRSRQAALELAEDGEKVLLHGDLHAGNVLDAGPERGLVVIDPRPCLGDPASDLIDWVLCPTGPAGRIK
ncbi:phosphotransferase [Amycolatopsis rhizosphaerae]|uniref:Phosphotransferase n=1 Tax=Amycolatopsis rhizosphaerae TaxID=2053003 RepID=A0A558D536_9PSEU|nr:phosphotransferase [Amycolatopsis rhizosphaerae]